MYLIGSSTNCGSSYQGVSDAPLYIMENLDLDKYEKVITLNGYNENNLNCLRKHSKMISCFKNSKNLTLGGDHTLTFSTLRESKSDSLIWIDSHADYNTTRTSPSGNYHGMVISMILNNFDKNLEWYRTNIKEENTNIIGLNSTDEQEKERLKQSEINILRDCNNIENNLEIGEKIHLSIDIDSLTNYYAPGVDVPEDKGMSLKQLNQTIEYLLSEYKVQDIDIVEYNPKKDKNNRTLKSILKIISTVEDYW
jgi:arginase